MSYAVPGSVRLGAPNALPKLHGRKRGDKALLCRMRIATTVALPSLRLPERAHCQVLRWLRQVYWGDHHSGASGCPRTSTQG
jgi:hypothetical protein